MKKIVVPAIVALVFMVGVYQCAKVIGASEIEAIIIAAFTAVAAFLLTNSNTTSTASTAFLIAATAVLVVAVATLTFSVFAVVVVTAIAVVFTQFKVAQEERLGFGWVFGVYVVECLTIFDAITIGSFGWSIVIVLIGIAGLLALWRFAPKSVASAPQRA